MSFLYGNISINHQKISKAHTNEDYGPQFISNEFSTPLWPQANGEVERQNWSLLKAIKIAQIEKIGKENC